MPAPVAFDPHLVEETVRLALQRDFGGAPLARWLRVRAEHRLALDRIYALPLGEPRETAFRKHFRLMFRRLELEERFLAALAAAWPDLPELERVIVRGADSRRLEAAELWERREERGSGVPGYLIVTVRPERLSPPGRLSGFLKRELAAAAEGLERVRAAGGSVEPSSARTRCPLCRFPTTEWALPGVLERLSAAIRIDFPGWRSGDGCCAHCADRYGIAPASS